MKKIVQTAGRNALNEFAPQFAHFNDDVLFGENWNNQDIDVKTKCIITVTALIASGMINTSFLIGWLGIVSGYFRTDFGLTSHPAANQTVIH